MVGNWNNDTWEGGTTGRYQGKGGCKRDMSGASSTSWRKKDLALLFEIS